MDSRVSDSPFRKPHRPDWTRRFATALRFYLPELSEQERLKIAEDCFASMYLLRAEDGAATYAVSISGARPKEPDGE